MRIEIDPYLVSLEAADSHNPQLMHLLYNGVLLDGHAIAFAPDADASLMRCVAAARLQLHVDRMSAHQGLAFLVKTRGGDARRSVVGPQ